MSWGIEFAGEAENVKAQLENQDAWMKKYNNDCPEWQAISAAGKALCDRVIIGNTKLSADPKTAEYRYGVYIQSNGHVNAGSSGESGTLNMRVIAISWPKAE